jgi:hypothetical protein
MDIGDHYYGTSVQEEGKKLKKNKLIPMYCWTYCHQTRLPVMLYPNPQSFHKTAGSPYVFSFKHRLDFILMQFKMPV